MIRAQRAFDLLLRGIGASIAVSLVIAAWHDVSQGYDVWYYHLPFAARLAGIMDAKAFAFSADNQARFEGFPLLAELAQGVIWRLTGHAEATSFVALGSLFALLVFLRKLFAVPVHLSLLALLAIPLVHIHATASYVDLPANACAAMLLLCVQRAIVLGAPTPRLLVGAAALAAAAANSKFQLVPIVVVASLALLWLSVKDARVGTGTGTGTGETRAARRALPRRLLVFVVAFPIVFATPLKNAVVFHNPVWPVELRVLGHSFPHLEGAYESSPPQLATSSRPMRFLHSVLEIDNRPIASRSRWSLDQWAPPDDPSYRMGGYFGAYVVVNLAALVLAVWRRRNREAVAAAGVFAAVTVVAGLVPQSHELRYYMHWMILLVSLNLVLWARDARWVVGAVAATALGIVVWSTSAGYLYASGSTLDVFLARRVDRSVIEAIPPGATLCISRPPFNLLYAPTFHPAKRFRVQEASTDTDCHGARRVTER